MTDAEIVAAVEQACVAQGRGETTIEPRMHLVPEKDYPGHFNVLRGYIRPLGAGRRQGGRRLLPQLRESACRRSWRCSTCSTRRPARRWRSSTPPTSPTCAPAPSPRSAPSTWRARTRRCWATSARAAPRTGTCACSTRSSTSTRSACTRAGRRAATPSRARLERDLGKQITRHRGLGVLRARRRHRRRGLAAGEARADAQDRVDQEGRLRHPLRHDERGRAVAHRHHGQDRDGRLGPGARPGRSARCARMSTAAGCRSGTCTPSSARSSPA